MPPRHRIVAWLTVLAAMVAAVISLHRAGLLWLPYLGTRAVRPPPQRSYLEGAERRCRRGTGAVVRVESPSMVPRDVAPRFEVTWDLTVRDERVLQIVARRPESSREELAVQLAFDPARPEREYAAGDIGSPAGWIMISDRASLCGELVRGTYTIASFPRPGEAGDLRMHFRLRCSGEDVAGCVAVQDQPVRPWSPPPPLPPRAPAPSTAATPPQPEGEAPAEDPATAPDDEGALTPAQVAELTRRGSADPDGAPASDEVHCDGGPGTPPPAIAFQAPARVVPGHFYVFGHERAGEAKVTGVAGAVLFEVNVNGCERGDRRAFAAVQLTHREGVLFWSPEPVSLEATWPIWDPKRLRVRKDELQRHELLFTTGGKKLSAPAGGPRIDAAYLVKFAGKPHLVVSYGDESDRPGEQVCSPLVVYEAGADALTPAGALANEWCSHEGAECLPCVDRAAEASPAP